MCFEYIRDISEAAGGAVTGDLLIVSSEPQRISECYVNAI